MADVNLLKARGKRAFPDPTAVFIMNRVRAIVASEKALPPTEQGRLAAACLRRLQGLEPEGLEGGDPSPRELAALELMIRMTRPAPLVHGGKPDDFKTPEQSRIFATWPQFRTALKPFAAGIGRIDTAGLTLSASATVGTGFLVAPGLLMTNRHVLSDLSHGTGQLETGQALVRFQYEADSFDPVESRNITGVAAVHPSLDAVLLRVESGTSGSVTLAEFATGDGEPPDDLDVVVAGYPAEMSDRNPLFLRSTFGLNLGVLRAAPGQITGRVAGGFSHDCSTLGGNSGSPVFRMSTAELIGLHTGGSFLWNNQAVDGGSLAEFVKANQSRGQ
jgi:Trypsin-like peptidase domain